MIARVSVAISIFATLLVGCATGTSAPTVTMSEEDAELAVYNYLYDTAVTSHGTKVLAAYMDAGVCGGHWPPNELTDRGWYFYSFKYKGDIESSPVLKDLFELDTSGECYIFCWLVEPDGRVVSVGGNAFMMVYELTKECGPAEMTEEEAGWAVYYHLSDLATSIYGEEVWAAYHDASWVFGPRPANECASEEGWYIYWLKDRYDIEDEPLLADIFEEPSYDGYSCCWLVRSSDDVIAIDGNALRLEAELLGE